MVTAAELQADLVVLRKARLDLAAGNRVDEVWRDGRRIVNGKVTLEALNNLIAVYEADIVAAINSETGRPRRSAVGVVWAD